MADLVSLLREVKGVYSDRARDRLPDGSVWEMVDWVPEVLQAGARMRGAWTYQSGALPNPIDGMVYAPFRAGSKLLAANGNVVHDIPTESVGATLVGNIWPTVQNPVFLNNRVIIPAASGNNPATYITYDGAFQVAFAPSTGVDPLVPATTGRYATTWKSRLVLGGTLIEPELLAFSKAGDPLAWDKGSLYRTSYGITGLAGQRTQVLVFHASSVERLRGTTPAQSDLPADEVEGDLLLDVLFDRAGCYDARSIAYWNDNVLWADARGIFLTDGAVVRNVADQGGVMNLWRSAFDRGGAAPDSIAAVVHQDYYICTVRHAAQPPITFVTEIPSRRTFVFGNIDSSAYAFSIGTTERAWASDQATRRVTDITPAFDPDPTILQVDADGTPVLPTISTGFDKLTKGEGFKRIREVHVTYEAHVDADPEVLRLSYVNSPTGQDQPVYEFKPANKFLRAKMDLPRTLPGLAVRLDQLVPTRDTRLYDISVWAYPEEANKRR